MRNMFEKIFEICRDAFLQPPGVRLGIITRLAVYFDSSDTVSV